jgi:hypothetical protein
MKPIALTIAMCMLSTTVGCGYIHLGFPIETTPSKTNAPFRCGSAGSVITVTAGTDALPDALPGSVTMTNLTTNQTSNRTINPMTNAAGAATVIFLACGDVNIKCNLQGFTAVKICGDDTVWTLGTGQIVITGAPFKSD